MPLDVRQNSRNLGKQQPLAMLMAKSKKDEKDDKKKDKDDKKVRVPRCVCVCQCVYMCVSVCGVLVCMVYTRASTGNFDRDIDMNVRVSHPPYRTRRPRRTTRRQRRIRRS